MEENGAPINRVINGGGIPKKNAKLNQIYANVLRKPVLVPEGDVTSLGSVIIAFLAAGDFKSIEEAQNALCPPFLAFLPEPAEAARYDRLFPLFRDAYFALGTADAQPAALGRILPELQAIRRDATAGVHEPA
jgi:L-ribulokinase